jgi:hypothetical protein
VEHVTEQAWADFVRGISTPETKSAIESHLASGCSACGSAASLWKSFTQVAEQERNYEPPREVVQLLQRHFALSQIAVAPRRLVLGLTFDSFATALPGGIRSGGATARQLVYEADGVTVDLRIDKHANSKALSIVGQVMDARTLRLASESVPVALLNREGETLQYTSTSGFGEFHLEVPVETEMQLAIEVDADRQVCITLPTGGCDRRNDFGEQNRLPGRTKSDYSSK